MHIFQFRNSIRLFEQSKDSVHEQSLQHWICNSERTDCLCHIVQSEDAGDELAKDCCRDSMASHVSPD